jgi:regulator of replication initiation timing
MSETNITQPALPGISGKKRRVRKFKEDYILDNAYLRIENTNLRNQITELSYQLEKSKLEKRNKELVGHKRGLFARLFRRKGRND